MADTVDKGALKPEILNFSRFMNEKPKEDIEVITQDEKVLAAGANTAFWSTLKKHFDESIKQLDQINEEAMAQGLPMEEIGRNAIVISQVKGVLNKIINVVKDAQESMEDKNDNA